MTVGESACYTYGSPSPTTPPCRLGGALVVVRLLLAARPPRSQRAVYSPERGLMISPQHACSGLKKEDHQRRRHFVFVRFTTVLMSTYLTVIRALVDLGVGWVGVEVSLLAKSPDFAHDTNFTNLTKQKKRFTQFHTNRNYSSTYDDFSILLLSLFF